MSGGELSCESLGVEGRLRDVSLTLESGSVTAICGPNGAGKSTLLGCLAGLVSPDAGMVRVGGQRLDEVPLSRRARRIGYLPQSPEIAWDVAVEVLVSLGRIPWKGAPRGDDLQAIEQAISEMDLERLRHRRVLQLSGGERARALMARVLATRPNWLLADEPLANLDLAHAAALAARLRAQAARGRGVVLVLHDLATAMNHADRVIVLDRGALAADGPARTALSEDTIWKVWGVECRWLGEPGRRALSLE
ncbi:ferrichrome ABC transporter ATP-binding protein [Novosphingobium sp. PC22D]|uniref:ABC transporter ATP-binding protein n=1 Tax=Novosphingobium sp. PC22D TaxID=1962403 RepID=UPI000BEF440F|nr:ABC transporter ATP-binding protein [Novosphingobium sp. PC22D]PEQ12008.1 ferrichrome ABC transporter ATP-binding protein [Novosphingobium sp. PC22D]